MTSQTTGPRLHDGFELAETRRTLPMALLRARELVMERFRPLLNANDVTEQQWRVMRVLHEHGDMDASRLARRASLLAPSLTRIIRALDARGFVQSARDPDDARRAVIAITQDGAAFIDTIAPQSAEIYRRIEDEIGSDRIAALVEQLDDLVTRLESGEP